MNNQRKKNKNDFYRFLLQQNFGSEEDRVDQNKCNNDILIPRSILKRNEAQPKAEPELDDFDELLNDAE